MNIWHFVRIRSGKTLILFSPTDVVRSACHRAATGSSRFAIDWAEVMILAAFIGAVFGAIGALAGALINDPVLCGIAVGGGSGCAAVWAQHLQLGYSENR